MNNQVQINFDTIDNGSSQAEKPVVDSPPSTGLSIVNNKEQVQITGGSNKVTYAGQHYEIIFEGARVMHLKSLRDTKLKIHCNVNSPFLSR